MYLYVYIYMLHLLNSYLLKFIYTTCINQYFDGIDFTNVRPFPVIIILHIYICINMCLPIYVFIRLIDLFSTLSFLSAAVKWALTIGFSATTHR